MKTTLILFTLLFSLSGFALDKLDLTQEEAKEAFDNGTYEGRVIIEHDPRKGGIPDLEFEYDVTNLDAQTSCYKRVERPVVRAMSAALNFSYPRDEYFCTTNK